MTTAPRFEISSDDPFFDPADSDPDVSPALDFYRFANGGWLDANPVPDEYGAWGAAHELHSRNEDILRDILERAATAAKSDGPIEQTVGDYYRSGMDVDRIESLGTTPLDPILETISSMQDRSDLAPVIADLHRQGIGAFFDVSILPDFEDATTNLLYLGQGGLGLPDRDYYLREDETSCELLAAYRSHVAEMFTLIEADDPETSATAVLDIETAIAEMSYTNVQMRDVDLTTNKFTTDDAVAWMSTLGLGRYLDANGAGEAATLNIDNEGFYPALDALIAGTALDDIKTYLEWNVLRGTASSLPARFEETSFSFYGARLGGQKVQKERWKRVLAAASSDIGHLVSRLYVAENFPPESKERMEHLVENLLEAMKHSIETLDWMSDETKARALEKLSGFGYKIGYPDVWRDYTGLTIDAHAWFDNRRAASRFEFDRQMGMLGQAVDPHEWSMAPHVVNAYYHPLRNEIVFPAGILQTPFFSLEADDAVNYGAIGSIIGHEITHGFDDQGSRFDADGNVRDWWTPQDRSAFEARAKVVIDQYNGFMVEDGLAVNGELTLGENIADIGGLRIAFAAMLSALDGDSDPVAGLTPQQRFYLAYATAWRQNYTDEYLRMLVNSDPHSPSHFRCSGPLSNLGTFAEAYGIPPDAPVMRPATARVDIW
ncbi:MAG: M13 family metallopeptidase [Actinomycetia bacterium]|nr:M13 family metallopeptidase [Actinomycetes bacterium]